MNVAYIVSAYKLPDQLVRLVHRLRTEGTHFVVHVDRKTDRRVYGQMVRGVEELGCVDFVPRHVCHWGAFGHVRATLKGIDRLYADGISFDYAVLLTGQDYPICPAAVIERRLAESDGCSFMNSWDVPHAGWSGHGGLDRIERWHLVGRRHLHVSLPLSRRAPAGLTPFGGGPYWCLARRVVDYVQAFVHEHPEVVSFFEHVWIPDELFFQTIVMSSPLRDTVVNDNLRFIDWSREPAPAILRRDDLESIVASGKLFARKFDATIDSEILDELDRRIDGWTA
jgi:hypothetical protein